MKRKFFTCFFPLAFFIVVFSAKNSGSQDCNNLPQNACAQLMIAIDEWNNNDYFKVDAQVISWRYIRTVNGEQESEELSEELTDPNNIKVWFPYMQYDGRYTAIRLGTITGVSRDTLSQWKADIRYADNQKIDWKRLLRLRLFRAKHVIEIMWKKSGEEFTTNAYFSDNEILYDSMLSGVRKIERTSSCHHVKILWIWGSVSGEIFFDLKCNRSGANRCLPYREHWMILGRTEAEIKAAPVGNTCQAQYIYGWSTPLADLTVDHSNFKVEVSGLGSGGNGSGQCSCSLR